MPARRTPVHLPAREANNLSPIVFVTVCAAHRKPILAKPDAVMAIKSAWQEADHWRVGRFVVMPDHVHLFCMPSRLHTSDLARWVKFWKSRASQRWPRPEEQPIWQVDWWDRQLRSGESYEAKWEYVRLNPVRRGLVTRAEDWPYQGEMTVLEWHDE